MSAEIMRRFQRQEENARAATAASQASTSKRQNGEEPIEDLADRMESLAASSYIRFVYSKSNFEYCSFSFFSSNPTEFDAYSRHAQRVASERAANANGEASGAQAAASLPYKIDSQPSIFTPADASTSTAAAAAPADASNKNGPERGFFVVDDQFGDEYKAGVASDLAEKEHDEFVFAHVNRKFAR